VGVSGRGDVKSVKSISRKDLAAWHKAWFRPSNAALFVVGDTDAATCCALESGSAAGRTGPPPRSRGPPAEEAVRVITLVDKPDARSRRFWIGEVGIASTAKTSSPSG